MKTTFYLLFVVAFSFTWSQEISMTKSQFMKWTDAEKKEKLFGLFEDDAPSDAQLMAFLGELLESGLDPGFRSRNRKESIFDACVRAERYGAAKLLLEKGYDPNQRCFQCNGETSLHKVVIHSGKLEDPSQEIADLLLYMLTNGGDADLRDMNTFTPVHTIMKNKDSTAFMVLMHEEVTFNHQLATQKGLGYLQYFDKVWGEDAFREKFMDKTGLEYPPTAKDIREKMKAQKEKEKEARQKEKDKKKDKKEGKKTEKNSGG